MAKTAEETLKTEVVIMKVDDLLWDSETAASAAYNRFTEAVAEAAEKFAEELRQATEGNVSEETRLCAVGEYDGNRMPDPFFIYGKSEARAVAEEAAKHAVGVGLDHYERVTLRKAASGEVTITAPSPNRCEPCDEWPERQADGTFVCPECEREITTPEVP